MTQNALLIVTLLATALAVGLQLYPLVQRTINRRTPLSLPELGFQLSTEGALTFVILVVALLILQQAVLANEDQDRASNLESEIASSEGHTGDLIRGLQDETGRLVGGLETRIGRLESQVGVLQHYGKSQLYSDALITQDTLRLLRVYVPVGLTEVSPVNDAKVEWIRKIQKRLREDPEFEFQGVYGLPPSDGPDLILVSCLLAGFAGLQQADLRVFEAPTIPGESTFTPGVGVLLADHSTEDGSDAQDFVLFGAATQTGSVRIDQAISVAWGPAYNTFDRWFSEHIRGESGTGVGRRVNLRNREFNAVLQDILQEGGHTSPASVTCPE